MKHALACVALLVGATVTGHARAETLEPVGNIGNTSGESFADRPSLHLSGRDRALLSGLATFGAAYWAALYVGGTSDLTSDHLLLLPLVGPWLSLAEREPCGAFRAPSCGGDGTARALFVVDGIAQGVGAALAVTMLLLPREGGEHARESAFLRVGVRPTPGGVSAVAAGRF